jgi:hypothetical protein
MSASVHDLALIRDKITELKNESWPRVQVKGGGGDGNGEGMEPRIARIEAFLDVIRNEVVALRSDGRDARDRLIRLEERVAHLPSKGFIFSIAMAIVGGLTAIIVLQEKLRLILGI